MSRRFNGGYYISEGIHSIFTHGFMSFAAVCMIIACLLIMGSFSLLAVNLDSALGDLEDENEILAYVEETWTEEEARELEPVLKDIPNVTTVTFVTREEAMESFRSRYGNNPLMASVPAERLRDRYRIHVEDIEQMEGTISAVEAVEGVAKVQGALAIAQGFVLVRNIATGVALALVAMLMVISLFIITNTIKLATFYRREEIAIMRMCGATNAFIEWPFVVEGLLLGLTGALVAFGMQWGLYEMVGRVVIQGNGLSLMTMIPFVSMIHIILPVFCGAGILIGVVGSLLAIRRFLRV